MTAPTVLYVGDSITDCGRRDDAAGLGDGYVRELAARQELAGWNVVNRGISGDRVAALRARWDADVLAEQPEVVSVFVGINEVWRRFDSDAPTSDAAFERDYRAVLDTITDRQLVLIEPFLLPKDAEQATWLDELDGKRRVVRELADAYGAILVPAHEIMSGAGDAAALAPDGVHPNAAGHAVLADAWLAHAGHLLSR